MVLPEALQLVVTLEVVVEAEAAHLGSKAICLPLSIPRAAVTYQASRARTQKSLSLRQGTCWTSRLEGPAVLVGEYAAQVLRAEQAAERAAVVAFPAGPVAPAGLMAAFSAAVAGRVQQGIPLHLLARVEVGLLVRAAAALVGSPTHLGPPVLVAMAVPAS